MSSVIRAIVFSAIAQVAVLALLVGYLFVHADNMSQMYATIAERNANAHTDEQVMLHNNQLQLQFQAERQSLQEFVEKRVNLRISQALRENKQ